MPPFGLLQRETGHALLFLDIAVHLREKRSASFAAGTAGPGGDGAAENEQQRGKMRINGRVQRSRSRQVASVLKEKPKCRQLDFLVCGHASVVESNGHYPCTAAQVRGSRSWASSHARLPTQNDSQHTLWLLQKSNTPHFGTYAHATRHTHRFSSSSSCVTAALPPSSRAHRFPLPTMSL